MTHLILDYSRVSNCDLSFSLREIDHDVKLSGPNWQIFFDNFLHTLKGCKQ